MPEKPMRVGDLIKAKDILREDVVAAIATVFDARAPSPSEREVMRSSCPTSPR